MSEANKLNKIDFSLLDGIRGLAAFGVVLNHARGLLFIGGGAYLAARPNANILDYLTVVSLQITSIGPQCVIIFFVLSGFSIAHSINRSRSNVGFYLRRFVRLYPPYIGGLILAWFAFLTYSNLGPIQGMNSAQSVFQDYQTTLKNLFYWPTGSFISQYWSLTHEVFFYMLAPLALLARYRNFFMIASSLLYFTGILFFKPVSGETYVITRFLMDYVFYFAVGVFVYNHWDILLQKLSMTKKFFYPISMVLIIALIVSYRFSVKLSFLISAILSIIAIVNFSSNKIKHPILRWMGSMSYTMYVTHFAAIILWAYLLNRMGFLNHFPSSNPWLWMSSLPFCLAVSYIFYLLFEKPSIKIIQSLREKSKTKKIKEKEYFDKSSVDNLKANT